MDEEVRLEGRQTVPNSSRRRTYPRAEGAAISVEHERDDEEEVEFQLKWQLAEVDAEDEADDGESEV